MFTLHPQLKSDTFFLKKLPLCQLLLLNDQTYPWFILVPERENIEEIFELSSEEQSQFLKESVLLAQNLKSHFKADKLNIAALGNIVPQLHIHHIVRYKEDKAWPHPVWGRFPRDPYSDQEFTNFKDRLRLMLESLQF